MNIASVKVTRVHRVHNRFLRNRFDARLESLVDITDSSYKKSLEYLFYGEVPGTDSLQTIIEEGFPAAETYSDLGMDAAVPLSNSVSTSDLGRVKNILSESGANESSLSTDADMEMIDKVRTGNLLIAKVYLGKYVQEHGGQEEESRGIVNSDYDSANSVFRVKPGDSKQRQWFIFDHALALPEYAVQFEYVLQKPVREPTDAGRLKLLADIGLEETSGSVRDTNGTEYGYLARPLARFCSSSAASCTNEKVSKASHAAINMPPLVEARPKVAAVTEKIALEACRVSLACNIVYLNLHGNNIRKIDGLSTLTAVKTLILSFNEIQKIEGLDGLRTIEKLDLGYNLIKRAEGLQPLTSLVTLELNNNLLYRLEDVSVLKHSVPTLVDLNLSHNAMCEAKGYRLIVLRRLPNINTFDGRSVDASERSTAELETGSITDELLRAKSATKRRPPAAGQLDMELVDGSWRNELQDIELDHCGVRRLQNLEGLLNLRRASFSDNELTHIEGLETCVNLRELILEENRIVRLDGLRNLVHLKRLDVGKNKLTKIEGLETLAKLTQLSIEDNEITSLAGLSKLVSLMELYIGNNRVTDLKEVHHVKELSKLIILDLSGNKLCTAVDYRHYTIYHIRKLKVLDGAGVEMMEQEAAKDKYDGKLTIEFVVERVGHSFLEHVRELNLAASRVRDLGDVMSQASFPGLKEVNLDNNQLTDLGGLLGLPLLTVLRLNHNRIEHLGGAAEDSARSGLPHLEVLQLGYNHINYIPSLRLYCFPELRSLYLQGNDITKIEGLERCVQLRELILDKNKMKSIPVGALANLTNLRTLRIDENGLRSLSNIAPLPRLQILSCVSNRVTELAETDKIAQLPSLTELNCSNCPVCRKQLYRPSLIKKFPALRLLDGKDVTMEERERTELLFSTEPHSSPTFATDSKYVLSNKVPVKLTSMNFDALTARQQQMAEAQQQPGGGQFGGHMPGQNDWHQYRGEPMMGGGGGGDRGEDFYLPKQKLGACTCLFSPGPCLARRQLAAACTAATCARPSTTPHLWRLGHGARYCLMISALHQRTDTTRCPWSARALMGTRSIQSIRKCCAARNAQPFPRGN